MSQRLTTYDLHNYGELPIKGRQTGQMMTEGVKCSQCLVQTKSLSSLVKGYRGAVFKPQINRMSIIKNGSTQCDICGRFIARFNNHYTWTYYGGTTDYEPPDSQHAHVKCFEKEHDSKEKLDRMRNICWLGPVCL
jgi:hypothetical protein